MACSTTDTSASTINIKDAVMRRQATTSTTYDYWWPYSPADQSPTTVAATTTTATAAGVSTPTSEIPILFSIISAVPTSNNNTLTSSTRSESSSSNASASRTSSTSTSTSSSASNSTNSSSASSSSTSNKAPFKLIDLAPAFGAVGVFILGLLTWVVYGCCTRKARVLPEDDLLSGPPYSSGGGGGGYSVYPFNAFDAQQQQRFIHGQNDGDIEDRLHHEEEMMMYLPKYAGLGRQQQQQQRQQQHGSVGYRWPSYSERPAFDHKTGGFYVPEEYKHLAHEDEEDGQLLSVALVAPGTGKTRSKSSRTIKSTSSVGVGGRARREDEEKEDEEEKEKGLLSRHQSSATSAALRSLYQSEYDSDDAEERNQSTTTTKKKAKEDETPWESLRHKSIRRGIVEKVKWMDTVRSAAAAKVASGFLTQGSPSGVDQDKDGDRDRDEWEGGGVGWSGGQQEVVEVAGRDGYGYERGRGLGSTEKGFGKRRGHVRADSDVYLDPAAQVAGRTSMSTTTPTTTTSTTTTTTKTAPTSPGGPAVPPKLARGRRSQAWLKDSSDGEKEDRYTRLPSRRSESGNRSRSSPSRSRSGTRSPTKRPLLFTRRSVVEDYDEGGGWGYQDQDQDQSPIRIRNQQQLKRYVHDEDASLRDREILPQSPPQLMSPPLESQIFFTSLAGGADNVNSTLSSSPPVSSTRVGAGTGAAHNTHTPTKIPSAKKKGKGKKSPPLPFPVSSSMHGHGSDSQRTPDVFRGRLLKKPTSRPSKPSKPKALSSNQGPSHSESSWTAAQKNEDANMMKKLDHIVQVGWSERERDLGQEGIRSLSPTGFGRRV